jgi:membrane fusion protein (multidrug efflux system)
LAIAIALGAAVVLLLLVVWWLHARRYESTDDAFIDTRTVQISAQISAAIVDVPVTP